MSMEYIRKTYGVPAKRGGSYAAYVVDDPKFVGGYIIEETT